MHSDHTYRPPLGNAMGITPHDINANLPSKCSPENKYLGIYFSICQNSRCKSFLPNKHTRKRLQKLLRVCPWVPWQLPQYLYLWQLLVRCSRTQLGHWWSPTDQPCHPIKKVRHNKSQWLSPQASQLDSLTPSHYTQWLAPARWVHGAPTQL